jgi:glycosyltransferase involved in cell wall biosynthesis
MRSHSHTSMTAARDQRSPERMRKLVVISHTPHQRGADGRPVGWGPTVRELDFLAGAWDEVVHVACLEPGPAAGSSLPYTRSNIRLEPIPVFGGKRLREKLNIVTQAPAILRVVRRALVGATHVQVRVPMGIGLFLLPWFALQRQRGYRLWVKYANNWGQRRPPTGYGLQRWLLHRGFLRCPVTINGAWPGQPAHCLSFENPCLYEADVAAGALTATAKRFHPPFRLAFTGRLEDDKGVTRILDALDTVGPEWVASVDFIGDGPDAPRLQAAAARHGARVRFHGFRESAFVHSVLEAAHFFVLPTTASEGFPKVVAEAGCHGCIPVVSDVSSIPYYVQDGDNGFLWHAGGQASFTEVLARTVQSPADRLQAVAMAANRLSARFTMEGYLRRLREEVFPAVRPSGPAGGTPSSNP